MQVRVQFFSHLRDLAATPDLLVEVTEGSKVSDLLGQLYRENPALQSADKTLLIAAGLEFVDRAYQLQEGDDLSLMPPVQGG